MVSITVTCPQTPPPAGGGGGSTDTTAPNTKRVKGPPRKGGPRLAKFVFTSTEPGSTFECKLDKAPYKRCRSPFKRKVSYGKHTLLVRATDAAGNTDPTPLRFRWTPVVPKPQTGP